MKLYDIAATELAWFGPAPSRTSQLANGVRDETTTFANELAQGHYHDIYLPNLHIGFGNLRPARPLRLCSQRPAPTLEMHFLLEGECVSRLTSPRQKLTFRGGESNLLFLPGPTSSYHVVRPDHPCREFEIHLSGNFLQGLVLAGAAPLAALAQGMQRGTLALLQPQHQPVSPAMHQLIRQITECPLQGVARRFLLEAKALELLALQLEQATRPAPAAPPGLRLRQPDVKQLHAARDLLLRHWSQPPTLPQLASQCGLNEYKLKKGFKQLFGDTVYGYLRHHKLAIAHQHLQQGEMTVAEVAEQAGYRHASHFTAAFKKHYGLLPKDTHAGGG